MLRNSLKNTHRPKVQFARRLRRDETPGEKILWNKLKSKRFYEFKFRRQVPIGPYIVDFLCVEKRCIIEIDGDSHYESGAQERDEVREKYLREQGFTVLRFGNAHTCASVDAVLSTIATALGIFMD